MFEQSGTFKNEFIKLGIPAEDYDIQNNFNETDYVIDLFGEIEDAYDDLKARLNTCGSVCLLPGIPVTILDGERIAQIVFNKLPEIEMTEVTADEFSEFTSERGAGGFGHSGRM